MKYQSDILEVIHESATEKFQIGAISEARMREYDKMCLVQEVDKIEITEEAVFDAIHVTA